MASKVIMPKAGMAMEEGTIMKWLRHEGDKVKAGEPLLMILTDKVNMEVEAAASGVLLKILKQEGEVVPVTHTIAYIGENGEPIPIEQTTAPTLEASAKERPGAAGLNSQLHENNALKKIAATPLAKTIARKTGIDLTVIKGSGKDGVIKGRDVEKHRNIKATPLASRIARELNLDMAQLSGSGHNGKIRKDDLPHTAEKGNALAESKSGSSIRKPMKGIRKIIADRMLKSHLEAPPVTLCGKVDVTELLSLRKQMNKTLGCSISVNDLVMKAAAQSLKEHSYVNVTIDENDILYLADINLGMAVALPDGLIVPVIRNADKLSLKELSDTARDLGTRAKEGKLMPEEIKGGTFTVSNLGMYGIASFTPIINPPESAILGVCMVEEVLRLENGRIESRSIMGLSLTIDHRVIDGAQGAIFLGRVKELLENPLGIVLER
jgi:pyruvate dehydrogenase E2 component (dihydrolipoamide acetyltransferase)